MFVFLSKLLPPLIYPLGLICILIIAGVATRRQPRLQRSILLLALLLAIVGGNRWTAMGLARLWEQRYLPPESTPKGEVIVLLGGGTESPDAPRPITEVNSAGDRVIYAAMLYKEGAAPNILVSGGLLDWTALPTRPAEDMAALLEFMGVPRGVIWEQAQSRNTYEDALYSAQILREKGIDRILLVTSAAHMPRSLALFEAQGLKVTPLPVDYTVTDSEWRAALHPDLRTLLIYLVPSVDSLSLTTKILKEMIGMLVYDLRGWY